MELSAIVRTIPNFPKKGIMFKDITPLLKNPAAFRKTIERLGETAAGKAITTIAAIESRGFIFGAAVALELGCGFVPIRKIGKLPAATISQCYDLEYGTDTIEMHVDALKPGEKVMLVDDLLATGGTMEAAAKLVEKSGAVVEQISFVIELKSLNGRDKLAGYNITSLIQY
jgi:adenine phosphoribosyltransferase